MRWFAAGVVVVVSLAACFAEDEPTTSQAAVLSTSSTFGVESQTAAAEVGRESTTSTLVAEPGAETTTSSLVAAEGTYLDDAGRVWMVSACPGTDPLIGGGVDVADGLPKAGQTDRDRVESFVAGHGDFYLDQPGVVAVNVVPRNGEVWEGPGNGVYTVVAVEDFMVEVVIEDQRPCPTAPHVWNGIPVVFTSVDEGG